MNAMYNKFKKMSSSKFTFNAQHTCQVSRISWETPYFRCKNLGLKYLLMVFLCSLVVYQLHLAELKYDRILAVGGRGFEL